MLPDGIQPVWDGIHQKPLREDQKSVFHLDLYKSAGISEKYHYRICHNREKFCGAGEGSQEGL